MTPDVRRIVVAVYVISAVVLALSFALPVARQTTCADAGSGFGGVLKQMFPDPNCPIVTSYSFFWEDTFSAVPAIFFLPLLMVGLGFYAPRRLRRLVALGAPVVAAWLLAVLAAIVSMADFTIFTDGTERAFGGFVALGALGCFVLAASALAAFACSEWIREQLSRRRTSVTMVCG
jgi:hypothetical protein